MDGCDTVNMKHQHSSILAITQGVRHVLKPSIKGAAHGDKHDSSVGRDRCAKRTHYDWTECTGRSKLSN